MIKRVLLCAGFLTLIFWASTFRMPENLKNLNSEIKKPQVLSRNGTPLNQTFANELNFHEQAELSEIPNFLKAAFIIAEDKRFFTHQGIDYLAKLSVLKESLAAGRLTRGASSISEQVVKILHPRARNLAGKIMEMIEARVLESRNSKAEILSFYLNQVPFAYQQRGVKQAALFYFDRDLKTLNKREMLALATLVRAPGKLDLKKNPQDLHLKVIDLAERMHKAKLLSNEELLEIKTKKDFELSKRNYNFPAPHFVSFILAKNNSASAATIKTTIDEHLQLFVNNLLQTELKRLKKFNVNSAASLVVDIKSGDILAYASVGKNTQGEEYHIDAVQTKRSPGSTLKPFVYALAFEEGLSPASLVDDAPFAQKLGSGMHNFKNYSKTFYGVLTLREALGNSLNIPVIKLVEFTGIKKLYNLLANSNLLFPNDAEHYGAGLALGAAPISLFELTQAYMMLDNMGEYIPLRYLANQEKSPPISLISPESASLVANVLSDSSARTREFGHGSPLNYMHQVAAKTGTSSGYHDALLIAYNSNYLVSIWMGNLDFTATNGLTGAKGPAFTARNIFAELNRRTPPTPLFISPNLSKAKICHETGSCISDYINPKKPHILQLEERENKIIKPTDGLILAISPRVPRNMQAFNFEVSCQDCPSIEWLLNNQKLATTNAKNYLWQLDYGKHELCVNIVAAEKTSSLGCVKFTVK